MNRSPRNRSGRTDGKNRAKTPPGLAARKAALALYDAVLRRGESLEAALPTATRGIASAPDRALAIAIAQEALRHKAGLDALIDGATRQRLPDDAKARAVLALMLVQRLSLDIAPHAIIATGLELLEGGPRRLAHGVFSALLKQQASLPQTRLPAPVETRWQAAWGANMVNGASRALGHAPPLDLSLKDADETALWSVKLGGTSLMPGHIRLPRGRAIEELPGFELGAWWVQDLAASLAVRMIGPGAGKSALDLCAAPGGKTMQLASQGWQVTALDSSERRMQRLGENLERTGLEAELVTADLLQWPPEQRFDAVLLDAPCSSSGIFRRHPDVLYRIHARDIAARAAMQAQLLERSAGFLKPGGVLVYAVCSLEPEEGEAVVQAFLADHPEFMLAAPEPRLLPQGVEADARGWLRIMPPALEESGGMDGFFIARMQHNR